MAGMFDVRSRVHTDTEIEDRINAVWHAQDGLGRAVAVREVQIYQAGFRAALEAVGLSLGVEWRPATADRIQLTRAVTVYDQRL